MSESVAINKSCSVGNAFKFDRTQQQNIGHVTSLKIGETELSADLKLKEPIEEGDVQVVGVLSNINWPGGDTDPLQFNMQLSVTNKNAIATLLHSTLKSVLLECTFTVYEYDPNAKKFFKCIHSNDAAVKGLFQLQGPQRVFHLSDQPGYEVQQPINYGLTLGMVPEDEEQEIHIAISDTDKFVKQWGTARG
jgi:hypothetical protein